MTNPQKIGKILATARQQTGLSMHKAGELAGLTATYVMVLERGTKQIKGKETPYQGSDAAILSLAIAVGADVPQVIDLAQISISDLELQRTECQVRLRAAGPNGIAEALRTLRSATILPAEA